MHKIILQIVSGILGLYLAHQFVSGVDVGTWKNLLLAGLVLGLINVFIKPVLKILTLPLRIITLGLFSLVINIGIIWLVTRLFEGLVIKGIVAFLWTAALLWIINVILHLIFPKKKT